jgi:hypothetical protein
MRSVTIGRLFLFGLLATPLIGQTADLSGIISDPSGLAVPNAKLTVKGQATGVTREATSNQEGLYSIPALSPGSYDLTVEATGFRLIHQNGIVLEVDQRASLDFRLSIGSTSESVTVEGSAPVLNSSDASVSTLIGNRFVANLPLNGRSFGSLIQLAPGVVLAPSNSYDQGQFSVNGQRPDANYFMVDGVSANVGPAGNGNRTGQSGAGELPATNALGGRPRRFRSSSRDKRAWRDEQSGVAGRARRISHSDFHLRAGIWPDSGRSDLRGHEVRHERLSRHCVRVFPE